MQTIAITPDAPEMQQDIDVSLYEFAHTQLMIAINNAREKSEDALLAYQGASVDDSSDAYEAWREAHIRHAALTEAGLIISLGFAGE